MTPPPQSSNRLLIWGIPLVALLWFFLWILPLLTSYHTFIFPTYDLGIYAEALHKISLGEWDPWIEVRGLRIFTDHFDPILIPFSLFAKGGDPAFAAILIESSFFLFVSGLLFGLALRNIISPTIAWLLVSYALFNLATQNATGFPIHPTAWSIFPILLLAVGRVSKKKGVSWLAMLTLLCCKEEFVFPVILVSGYLIWRRELKLGLAGLILGVAWGIFVFFAREYFFGKTMNYGGDLLREVISHPFTRVFTSLSTGKAMTVLGALVAPIVFLIWTAKDEENTKPIIKTEAFLFWSIFLLPILSIRLVSPLHWQHHYSVPIAACLAGFLLNWGHGKSWAKWVWWVFLALMLLTTFEGTVRRLYSDPPFLRHLDRLQQEDRAKALETTRLWLMEHPNGNLVAQQNLAPRVLNRGRVYHWSPLKVGNWGSANFSTQENGSVVIYGAMPNAPLHGFKYLWFEKPPSGDSDPIAHEEISAFLQKLRGSPKLNWIRDDAFQVLIEADFIWSR